MNRLLNKKMVKTNGDKRDKKNESLITRRYGLS